MKKCRDLSSKRIFCRSMKDESVPEKLNPASVDAQHDWNMSLHNKILLLYDVKKNCRSL